MVHPGEIFARLQSEFFAALEASRVDADPKAVHRLRTTARRMEALLYVARQRGRGVAGLDRAVDRALKALKPVRTAAGVVRDLDVQRGLLEGMAARGWSGAEASERHVLSEEAEKLQAKLKRWRRKAAGALAKVIERSEKKELRRISSLQAGVLGEKWTYLLKEAKVLERQSAGGLEVQDAESLHEYRKRSKFARYLAEMDEGSRVAAQFAVRIRKVLDAIGEWHDWMLLAGLAEETVGRSSTLAGALKGERDKAWRRAVRSVRGFRRGRDGVLKG